MSMKYECPVCAMKFNEPWENSQDICPGCGIQFGYDDAAGGSEELRQRIYTEWRKVWEENSRQKLTNEQISSVHESTHPQ